MSLSRNLLKSLCNELYDKAYTPWDWHEELFEEAKKNNLVCFSTPFDKSSVDFLEKLNVPAYKLASFEITDYPLIKKLAKTKSHNCADQLGSARGLGRSKNTIVEDSCAKSGVKKSGCFENFG